MFLSKYDKQIFTILRVVVGFLYLWHGSQKIFNYPPAGYDFPVHILYIAGPIEFFGGLFIMFGFLTRWAAFIASGEMAYAYWTAHAPAAILPLLNHGELAMIYCFIFLFFTAYGIGKFSIDGLLEKKKTKE